MTKNLPLHEQNLPAYYQEDEISLVDLWLVLIKRRAVLMSVAILCVLAGLLYAILMPGTYKYSTSIEIGTEVTKNGVRLIESTETSLAKITEGYIPQAIQQYLKSNSEDERKYKITARIPKSSQIVVLEAKDSSDVAPTYLFLLESVVGLLVADHERLMLMANSRDTANLERARIELAELLDESTMKVRRDELAVKLNNAEIALANVKDPRVFAVPLSNLEGRLAQAKQKSQELKDTSDLLMARKQRQIKLAQLLEQQVAELSKQVTLTQKRHKRAISEVTGESNAMVLMMIDNEDQQNRSRLDSIKERLAVELPNEQQTLGKQMEDNKRTQEAQLDKIVEIQNQLEKLRLDHKQGLVKLAPIVPQLKGKFVKLEQDHRRAIALQQQRISELESLLDDARGTHAIVEPMQSLEPVGPSKKLIVALAAVLGVMLGVFAAFFAEFLSKVNDQSKQLVLEDSR